MIFTYTCSQATFYGDATLPATYFPAGAVIATQVLIDPLPAGFYNTTPGYSADFGPPIVQIPDAGNQSQGTGNASVPPWTVNQ
jgi:hypothetical protein